MVLPCKQQCWQNRGGDVAGRAEGISSVSVTPERGVFWDWPHQAISPVLGLNSLLPALLLLPETVG